MKKLLAILLALTFAFPLFTFTACGSEEKEKYSGEPAEKAELTVYAPDGAPALAISKFISDKEDFGTGANMTYNVIAADTLQAVVGTGDIIVMPINLATKIYKAKGYKMAGVVTHGNLYLMAKEDLTLDALKGKVVGVANLANVPGLTFKAVLAANGIEFETSDEAVEGKVALKGYTGQELMVALKTGAVSVGLLPEPVASKLVSTTPEFNFALDLQALYDAEEKAYPQAVVMVKNEVIAAYPELIKNFGDKIAAGVTWIKNNQEAAVEAVASVLAEGVTQSMTNANLTAEVVDNCKIYFEAAISAQNSVNKYIAEIRKINEAAANEVTEDFFA